MRGWARECEPVSSPDRVDAICTHTDWPARTSMPLSGNLPTRILGPWTSWMMATATRCRSAAWRIAEMAAAWDSCVPWEKFSRAAFMPLSMSCSSIDGDAVAGPMVQTILALRIMTVGEVVGGARPVLDQPDIGY